ncbi:MAG TPA: hypothetical protein DD381_11010 [Lentisphaeria bacterium]|nr:MAG: hypothetical protein A2X47_00590 [Lentisphaerae bacterium GWF2_38_69]HBM16857.1 hypothetical protein [Lentisphaeria bacterium]
MKSLRSFFVLIALFSFCCIGAQAVNLKVDKATPGWTGTITFHADKDVDLATSPLTFDLSKGTTVSSVWGLANSSFKQTNQTVSVTTYSWWPENQGYILKANTKVTISFGANAASYTIYNVKINGGGIDPTPDITAPVVNFINPTDKQIIEQSTLSPIDIKITATDDSGSVTSTITAGGKTFNGTTATFTPTSFGSYSIVAKATDPSGNKTSKTITITVSKTTEPTTDTGKVYYHLTFPVSVNATSSFMPLNDNFKDLIMSNFVAGVLLGHLINHDSTYYALKYSKDYLYGSLFAQLLQEDLDANIYLKTTDWITPNESYRKILLSPGQGGPYQLNDYSKALEHGYGLINYAVLQKSLGYSVKDQGAAQTAKTGPDALDNKYFGPIAAAYFHYNDLLRLASINKDPWGPSAAYFADCMKNFSTSDNSLLDMVLNATYNAGPWSDINTVFIRIGANMNNSTYADKVANINNYSLNDAQYSAIIGLQGMNGTTYILYPRQIRFYLDEMYNKTTLSKSSYTFQMSQLKFVFSKCYSTLAYVNSSKKYVFINPNDADKAFDDALVSLKLTVNSKLNVSNKNDRDKIFSVLEKATANLSANLHIDFGKIVTTDL